MIYNRTLEDVLVAIKIRDEKVKAFQELTESEISIIEKGTMTINTLNRIESKQDELKHLINDMGYHNTPIVNKTWNVTDIFDYNEFKRIVSNDTTLREAFFVSSNTPKTPAVSYHYEDINALEKILYDIDVMINDVKSHYIECGQIECGEE